MSFQNKGFWMAKGAGHENDRDATFGSPSRIEPKRSHQWFVDSAEPQIFPNKKQAVHIPNSKLSTDMPNENVSWENPSSFQSVPHQFIDRLFGSDTASSANFSDRNVSPVGSDDWSTRTKGIDDQFGEDAAVNLSISHAIEDPEVCLGFAGIRKIKVNQVKDSDNGMHASREHGSSREYNSNLPTSQAFDRTHETSFISAGQAYDKEHGNVTLMGHAYNQGAAHVRPLGPNYGKREENVISMGDGYSKGNANMISFGGFPDEQDMNTMGRAVANYDQLYHQSSVQTSETANEKELDVTNVNAVDNTASVAKSRPESAQIKTRPFEPSEGSLTHPFLQLFSFEISHDLSFPTPILSPSTSPITILDPIMSHLALSQVSLTTTVPAGSDLSLRRSVFKAQSVNFSDKSWAPVSTLDLKTKSGRLRNKRIVCMSVQQASAPKVAVSPLELDNATEPPLNIYKPKEPYTATILSVERIVGPRAPGETCHIVIDHGGNVPYWEGQSYGVIPPGENPKKPGAPHNVRLYSIASTRYGDYFDGKTTSLCVRRAVYYDPETGKEDPSKNGVCSNYLCNSKPGDKIKITGPAGKIMLLPEDNPNATHIMIATGTGVAPYRGYLRRMFMEAVPTFKFGGLAWLFLGVANTDSLLYDEEFCKYLKDYPDNFRYDIALSREQKNKRGGKMYVQDKIEEYSDEIFKLLDGGAHIYFCGLKGMMPGIQETLKRVAEERGESWEEKLSQLKKNKQWHVEVY